MVRKLRITLMKTIRSVVWYALSVCWATLSMQAASIHTPPMSPENVSVLRSGDARKLREALEHGFSADARDALGNTPLMHAAVYGDLACIRTLVDRGADVNATNAAGATALMRAALDYEKVALLLGRGADVNARSALGNTALILAARPAKSHRTVALLLSHGADAKATNNWGATALMAAVAGGDEKSVRLLLKHGADVNAQPALGPGRAFEFGGGRSVLMWAAYRGDLAILKLLIDAGADVNAEGLMGTPLSQAAWANRTTASRLLIERGAKVDQVAHMAGYAPL